MSFAARRLKSNPCCGCLHGMPKMCSNSTLQSRKVLSSATTPIIALQCAKVLLQSMKCSNKAPSLFCGCPCVVKQQQRSCPLNISLECWRKTTASPTAALFLSNSHRRLYTRTLLCSSCTQLCWTLIYHSAFARSSLREVTCVFEPLTACTPLPGRFCCLLFSRVPTAPLSNICCQFLTQLISLACVSNNCLVCAGDNLECSASTAQRRWKLFQPCVAWPKGALLGLVAKMNVAESLLENQNSNGNIC